MLLFCLNGFVFVSVSGASLHFVYDWLKHNRFVSLFVPVNESTWEHLKLVILPTFLWALVGLFFTFKNYAFAIFCVLGVICVIIPIFFYTYTHFTKRPILFVDITSFFVAVGIGMFVGYLVMNANEFGSVFKIVGIVGIVCFALSFLIFTYFPPRIFLFRDPITNKFGRAGHSDDETFGDVEHK